MHVATNQQDAIGPFDFVDTPNEFCIVRDKNILTTLSYRSIPIKLARYIQTCLTKGMIYPSTRHLFNMVKEETAKYDISS